MWGCVQVRGFTCACSWPALCDSQGGGLPLTRMQQIAAEGSAPISGPEAELILAALEKAKTGDAGPAVPPAAAGDKRMCAKPGSGEAADWHHKPAAAADSNGRGSAETQSRKADGEAAVAGVPVSNEGDPARTQSLCTQDAADVEVDLHRQPEHGACTSSSDPVASPVSAAECGCEAQPGDERVSSGQAAGASARGPEDSSRDAQLEAWEARHVHSVYDVIASHFSATRFAVWPKVSRSSSECLFSPHKYASTCMQSTSLVALYK